MAKLQEYELEEMFNEYIDECVELIDIFGMKYAASDVLKGCDPCAYHVTFSDWADSLDNCDDCELNPLECECEEI